MRKGAANVWEQEGSRWILRPMSVPACVFVLFFATWVPTTDVFLCRGESRGSERLTRKLVFRYGAGKVGFKKNESLSTKRVFLFVSHTSHGNRCGRKY